MDPANFKYDLPDELIAQVPLPERSGSRLLHVPSGDAAYSELLFLNVGDLLQPGDLLVLNDTRVIPGRLYGSKASGGKVEMLLERILEPDLALVQLRSSRSPKVASQLMFEPGLQATVEGREGTFFLLRFTQELQPFLEKYGHVPLPPYIQRADDSVDRERYQTIYAQAPGAVAAPTAGLHFDRQQFDRLAAQGVDIASVTLHVGAGTFAPLREAQLSSGRLHAERVEVTADVCEAVRRTRERGGRVVAIGTTTMRALESAAAATGALEPLAGETTLFIRPGYRFRVVDALLTNFHLPDSSLLMLVCAFAGTRSILAAYAHAVRNRYRFFSYGDAMFCYRRDG